jgi:hypothetical protein
VIPCSIGNEYGNGGIYCLHLLGKSDWVKLQPDFIGSRVIGDMITQNGRGEGDTLEANENEQWGFEKLLFCGNVKVT